MCKSYAALVEEGFVEERDLLFSVKTNQHVIVVGHENIPQGAAVDSRHVCLKTVGTNRTGRVNYSVGNWEDYKIVTFKTPEQRRRWFEQNYF